ncbi:TlpA family protein disulfide reductase [Candidatus Pelagibacter sp.]|nr:TlpA family protein disulfide reductase [Candidatus Pelagibacter sp.]
MLSNSFANEVIDIKNLLINKELKNYGDITFLDIKNKEFNLSDYKGNLVILNFWATWCAPCKDEMPSLDLLTEIPNLDNLKIFPINIGKDDNQKSLTFYEDLKIKNLEIYLDPPNTLAKKFQLRGLPTTILFNKDGLEFARIIGSIDFADEKFIKWLSDYN